MDYTVYLKTQYMGQKDALFERAAADYFAGIGVYETCFLIEKTKEGKPFFKNIPEVHFSLSHSDGVWVCAFGKGNIGIDIQTYQPCKKESLAMRFFHPEEVSFLRKNNFQDEDFFAIWAAKESYLKYTGEGLGGLRHAQVAEEEGILTEKEGVTLRFLPLLKGYACCIAADSVGTVKIVNL